MTNVAHLRRLEKAFLDALTVSEVSGAGALTPARLDAICGGDRGLAGEVRALLGHASAQDEFLDPGELHGTRAAAFSRDITLEQWGGAAVGQRIGEFLLLGQLGAGGMGVVYLAEQRRPRRTVALKLIRRTVATPAMVARFEREADLLGRLCHPGIAQIYAAGVAEIDGATGNASGINTAGPTLRVPYIAMELIEGPSIAAFVACRGRQTREVLGLIIQVCDAVQHAHSRGVVHRDLKPDNLLVTSGDNGACVKILDFGVGRAFDEANAGDALTRLTGQEWLIGTLAYMSPEQLRIGHRPGNNDSVVDRAIVFRSDIYALGAILFQLLCGRHPIDLADCPLPEAVRRMAETEPARLASCDAQFRGDLDSVVARALARDPERRYSTAADLAADLRRFLAGEPVKAQRDSLIYRIGKLPTRYRDRLRLAAGLTVALAGMLISFHLGQRRSAADGGTSPIGGQSARHFMIEDATSEARLERARFLIAVGDRIAAEDMIWPEYLKNPESTQARLVLSDLLSPLRIRTHAAGCTATALSAADPNTAGVLISASAGGDGKVHVWEPVSGASRFSRVLPMSAVSGLRFDAGALQLLVAGPGGLSLLNTADGHVLWQFQGTARLVTAADLSRDGHWIVAALDDGSIRLWEVPAGKPLFTLAGGTGPVRYLKFDRSADHIAAAFDSGRVRVWTIAQRTAGPEMIDDSPAFLASPALPAVVQLGFSPGGSILYTTAEDGSVVLRSLSGDRTITTLSPPTETGSVGSSFHP